jgi:hypothetical protein
VSQTGPEKQSDFDTADTDISASTGTALSHIVDELATEQSTLDVYEGELTGRVYVETETGYERGEVTPDGLSVTQITAPEEELKPVVRIEPDPGETIDGAVLRPTGTRTRGAATRGAVIGHDDTPAGLFCHVIDITNLHHNQHTTRAAIRDVMGFDREIDPYEPPGRLAPAAGEQIRSQGDLRVERTDDVEGFPDEVARTVRLSESRTLVDATLDGITVPDETTLHVVHDEHNTVTVQIPGGVYRFSLLPRGVQPPSERPEWPTA